MGNISALVEDIKYILVAREMGFQVTSKVNV